MQRLEVSGAVRLIYRSLDVKGLKQFANFINNTQLNAILCLNRVSESCNLKYF